MWPFALPLLVPALAGLAARPLAGRLEPRQAVWLLTATSVALAACSTAALALAVAFAAMRSPVLAAAGDYSLLAVRRADPVPALAGLLAALLLTGAVVGIAAAIRRRAIAITRSYRHAATLTVSDGIVVLPGPAVDAYALPGGPGRIVISGCLLDRLDPRRRDALVAHEHAHLTGRHYLFASAAGLAAAANPLLLPAARAVDFALERWADEHAAAVTGDRRLVAETIGQVALLASPRDPRPVAVAFGALGSRWHRLSVATAGPVPRRVAALLTSPPRRGNWVPAAAVAIVLLTAVAAALAAVDLHGLVEFAQAADQGLRG
jgi:beta-lactamase regulating signal transducer with metallopeptidase domain